MKKLVITLALVLTAGTMFAQQDDSKASRQRWRNFETNKFTDNWEFSFGAGMQTIYGFPTTKNDVDVNPQGFGKDLTLGVDASLGKWFTPIIGARFGVTGWQMTNYYAAASAQGEGIKNEWEYVDFHADFLVNLTNWVCHYKADRFYNAIGYVGVGLGNSWVKNQDGIEVDDPSHNYEFIVPVGLINRFRLCDRWTFNIELRDQITRNEFANRGTVEGATPLEQSSRVDNIFSVTAGFTWKFSHKNDFNVYTPIDKAAYDNRISSLEKDLQSAQDQNAEYQKQVDRYKQQLSDKDRELQEALRKASENANTPVSTSDDVTLSIFFPIGSAEVSDRNQVNIKYMAEVIKASNKTFTITGYADNNSGSEQRNLELSQQRAEAVYNALIDAGVDKSKIKVDYKGCTVQPFEKDYLNRVAIIK
jgi:outer membrane protein OmpA-like peptidoglycan-associated protein